MAIKPILTAENPVLRQKSRKVRQFGDNLAELVKDMFETMHASNGLGLAAPQIGVLQRVVVIELPAEYDEQGQEVEPAEAFVLVNPEIIKTRGEEEMEEGCLSVPGFRGLVKRATQATVRAQDLEGRIVRYKGYDLLAHAFQHEIDHLDGVLYLDRLESPEKLWRIPIGEEEAESIAKA
jgi:peptide deformylase